MQFRSSIVRYPCIDEEDCSVEQIERDLLIEAAAFIGICLYG